MTGRGPKRLVVPITSIRQIPGRSSTISVSKAGVGTVDGSVAVAGRTALRVDLAAKTVQVDTAAPAAPVISVDGWLRKRFDTLGVSQFEDWVDTGEEYELLDEVAKDREAAALA